MPTWTCLKCGKNEEIGSWKVPPWKSHACRQSVMETPIFASSAPKGPDAYLERLETIKIAKAQEFTRKWGPFFR